jgi:ribosome-associated toxin RatA of RatAB toxin-antitoxin module
MVTKKVTVDAPIAVLWETVTDLERYPDFIKELKSVKIDGRQGNKVTATFEVELIKSIRYTLSLTEEKPRKFSWTLVKGQMMSKNDGWWDLAEEGPERCSAAYNTDIKFGLLVPSSISNMLTEVNLPKMLDAFKKRAEQTWQTRKAAK